MNLSKDLFGIVSLVSLLAVPACGLGATTNSTPAAVPMQQRPGDLFCGTQRAICYSGFRHGEHPDRGSGAVNPSDKEILEDLQILRDHGNFSVIRLYDAQENSEAVLRLIQSEHLPMKVVLGAWLDAEMSNSNCPWQKTPLPDQLLKANRIKNGKEIERAIRVANQYSNVVAAVAVGNEALVSWSDHMVPVESVIRYVRQVKKSVSQPVTVADNYEWWAHHGTALAKQLDFISVHTYPLWEGKDIDQAMAQTISTIQEVRNALPLSRMVITEAGWASVGNEFGPRAGEEKQQQYYHDLYAWTAKMNITTFFFEAFDEDWKGESDHPLAAEKHWGIFTTDRKPKLVMKDL